MLVSYRARLATAKKSGARTAPMSKLRFAFLPLLVVACSGDDNTATDAGPTRRRTPRSSTPRRHVTTLPDGASDAKLDVAADVTSDAKSDAPTDAPTDVVSDAPQRRTRGRGGSHVAHAHVRRHDRIERVRHLAEPDREQHPDLVHDVGLDEPLRRARQRDAHRGQRPLHRLQHRKRASNGPDVRQHERHPSLRCRRRRLREERLPGSAHGVRRRRHLERRGHERRHVLRQRRGARRGHPLDRARPPRGSRRASASSRTPRRAAATSTVKSRRRIRPRRRHDRDLRARLLRASTSNGTGSFPFAVTE